MNGQVHRALTFSMLDQEKGILYPPPADEEFPLPAWYRAVREIPIEELSVGDICKACRQQIHIEHVVLIALRFLHSEPLAGEMYDGELLASLKSIPSDYWSRHATEVTRLKAACEAVHEHASLSDNVRRDVADLLGRAKFSLEIQHDL